MSTILQIETATQVCSVALAVDGEVVALKESSEKNSHAANITLFIEDVIRQAGISFKHLDAVAVSKGPGSYTGLRIGVSTAKGFCYALDVPLIGIGTLNSLAAGMIQNTDKSDSCLFCPMIDARRMEVYAAVFDAQINEVKATEAIIIDEKSFADLLARQTVVFAGDGAAKCIPVLSDHPNALFLKDLLPSAAYMSALAYQYYKEDRFEDTAYFEPYYLKDFVAGIPKVKGL